MRIDHAASIEALRQIADLTAAVPSHAEYPWDAASRLKRFLLEDGIQDSDLLTEERLTWYARAALRYAEPEWTGLNDQDATPLHEHFTPRY